MAAATVMSNIQTKNKLVQYTTEINREYVRENLFSPYMGTDASSIIRIRNEAKKGGDQINFPMVGSLYGPGTPVALGSPSYAYGVDTLTGNDKLRAENDAKDGACDYFNYGFSLTIMQPIRTMLTNSLGGVDKEIDKQVAQAMKMGIFPSAEEARAMIIAQREKIGLEIPAETGE